ncbi:uncharacterized protein ATC70_011075 [Mucor velutinosus]|uniref:Uncharacterized protein n=1 Tax=Mucor velutinosus TaxID=708070 RepID=A0AAN7I0D4_9FUNG|nr:hypothetical protein ATC70_011075 [Mucor velutinosus]
MAIKRKLIPLLFISNVITSTHQQQVDSSSNSSDADDDDDDGCAFISGQHCDQNGICKYCAMCLQSSCILSKTIGGNVNTVNSCNTTQFGTTNLYNWYDYCLSSDNDNSGDYCATSTECYQYRKSAGPSVTYAWHNLTCNPSTCMLIASNGAPPPIPVPPQIIGNNGGGIQSPSDPYKKTPNSSDNTFNASEADARHHFYHNKFHNPAAIALTIVCCLVLLVAICWMLRLCNKKGWWPFTKNRLILTAAAATIGKQRDRSQQMPLESHNSISSIPSSAPPSFSSTPPDMAVIRHPHLHLYTHQPLVPSGRSSTASSSNNEPLPSYLSPYLSPPKYEQAIVTQIRGLREEGSSSNSSNRSSLSHTDQYHRNNTAPLPSMWVPVYFTQQHQPNFGRGRAPNNQVELYGFTPNPVFWASN